MDSQMKKSKSYLSLFIWTISILTVFRLFCITVINLEADEAYYWQWSRHLALSYYDHPPMVAYIIFLFTHLGATTEFFVRLGSVIFALWGTILVYCLTLDMFKSEKTAFYATLLFNFVPLYALGAIIIAPDVPMVFFWLLTLYLFWKALNQEKSVFWYFSGVTLGLGLLSKYPMVLLPPSLFLFLLFSAKHRRYLFRKEPYVSLLIASIIFSPVIIWNLHHGWASLNFQFDHAFSEQSSPSFPTFITYVASQLLLISPLVFLGCIFSLIKSGVKGIRKNDDAFLFLFFPSLLPLAFFGISSLFSKANANWPIAGYSTLFIALAYFMRRWLSAKRLPLRILGASTIISSVLVVVVFYIQAVKPILPLSSDPTLGAYGWSVAAKRIEDFRESVSAEDQLLPILTPGYPLASVLSFYLKDQPYVYPLFAKERKDQYSFWKPNIQKGDDAIYVIAYEHHGRGQSFLLRFFLQWEIAETHDPLKELPKIRPFFQSVEYLGSFSIFREGTSVREFALYLARDFKGFSPLNKEQSHMHASPLLSNTVLFLSLRDERVP